MTTSVGARLRLAGLFLVALSAGGCAGGHPSAPAAGQVKVNVGRIGVDHRTGTHYVLLRDKNGTQTLPIMIGESEARAILLAMHGVRPARPLTDQLMSIIIRTTGNHVDRVVIADLRDDIYYAEIYLDDGRYKIDSRPSDAIALAMNTDAPIYVVARLFEKPAPQEPPPGKLPATTEALGLTVQELTPPLASYFKLAPASGLLVADSSGPAAAAGLRRGDVVTLVGGEQVTTLDSFNRSIAKLEPTGPITLTIRRNHGGERVITIRPPPQDN